MVSYEMALGLSLVGVLIMSGSLSLREIVDAQAGQDLPAAWARFGIFAQQVGA